MINLSRFTEAGLSQFRRILDEARTESPRALPAELLSQQDLSVPLTPALELGPAPIFNTRLELAEFLDPILNQAALPSIETDTGLWSWLTAYLFDSICPSDRRNGRRIRETAAYIPEAGNFRRYYRHLLLGPYLIYRAHRENPRRALSLLCKPPHLIDDIVAQLASRQEMVTNVAVVEAATRLYVDSTSGTMKKGAGSKGPGSPRRLVAVLDQLDVTWDLYSMSASELLGVLPGEFSRFKETLEPIAGARQ